VNGRPVLSVPVGAATGAQPVASIELMIKIKISEENVPLR